MVKTISLISIFSIAPHGICEPISTKFQLVSLPVKTHNQWYAHWSIPWSAFNKKEQHLMSDEKDIAKKCKLELDTCVWIHFKGDTTNRVFPQIPEDDGIVHEFLKWCFNNKIFPVPKTPGTSGGGVYAHAHYAKDANKIIQWFKDRGVTNIIQYADPEDDPDTDTFEVNVP